MVVPLWNVKDNFNTVPEVLAPATREQEELKGLPIGKEISLSSQMTWKTQKSLPLNYSKSYTLIQ